LLLIGIELTKNVLDKTLIFWMTKNVLDKTLIFWKIFRSSRLTNAQTGAILYIFKPKISIWVKFGGPWNGKGSNILWQSVIYYGHMYFMANSYLI
jgi:hypothetical protein